MFRHGSVWVSRAFKDLNCCCQQLKVCKSDFAETEPSFSLPCRSLYFLLVLFTVYKLFILLYLWYQVVTYLANRGDFLALLGERGKKGIIIFSRFMCVFLGGYIVGRHLTENLHIKLNISWCFDCSVWQTFFFRTERFIKIHILCEVLEGKTCDLFLNCIYGSLRQLKALNF